MASVTSVGVSPGRGTSSSRGPALSGGERGRPAARTGRGRLPTSAGRRREAVPRPGVARATLLGLDVHRGRADGRQEQGHAGHRRRDHGTGPGDGGQHPGSPPSSSGAPRHGAEVAVRSAARRRPLMSSLDAGVSRRRRQGEPSESPSKRTKSLGPFGRRTPPVRVHRGRRHVRAGGEGEPDEARPGRPATAIGAATVLPRTAACGDSVHVGAFLGVPRRRPACAVGTVVSVSVATAGACRPARTPAGDGRAWCDVQTTHSSLPSGSASCTWSRTSPRRCSWTTRPPIAVSDATTDRIRSSRTSASRCRPPDACRSSAIGLVVLGSAP